MKSTRSQKNLLTRFHSPESQTISGDISKIDALVTLLSSEKVFARKLQVELAYHSRYMEPIRDDYLKAITGLPTVTGSERLDTKYFSSTYGGLVPLKKLQNPEYWIMNLRSTVRFSEAVQSMLGSKSAEAVDICGDHKLDSCPITDLLEIGPHSALKGPLRTILTGLGINDTIKYHSMVVRNSSAAETALEAAGALFCRGHVVNLETINDHGGRVVSAPRMLTNLPSYAFDHTKDYWHESRLDRNTRFPSAARHDLLGAPVPDWNVNNAVWRNYIRLSESPWVEDHQVSGEILYPAAGMLVMAIEASLQLAVKDKTPKAFKFKEVSFHQALRLSAESGQVETHFYLRPHWSSVSLTESTWNEFQLFTHENNEWREHCRGLVTIEYEAEYNPVDGGEDDKKFRLKCRQDIEDAQLECTTEISRKKVYRAFRDIGLEFGDTFQTLQGVQVGANFTSMARVDGSLAALKKAMPESYLQTHHVHPTTLDGVIQASILPLAMSLKDACQAVVPTYIGELWVSADPSIAHDSYQVASRMSPVTRASTQCSITALHSEHKHPMVVISDIALKLVPGEGAHSFQDLPRRSFNIDWKPDPTFVRPDEAEQVFGLPMSQDSGAPDYIADCELLCLAYMRQYLDRSSEQNAMNLPAHFRKYNVWLKQTLGKSQDTSIGLNLLEEKVIARNTPEGKLVVAVGRVLTEIIQGSKDPLEILFSDGLAEDVYRDGLGGKRAYAQLSRYIDALAHQNPAMEILEIGAGTGGATKPVMATLTQQGSRYKHYTFTDISPAFLEAARTTFEDQLDRMSFKLLNVERSPADQDFATGQYDVVIGANVLHATKNIDETLKNARQLLKPGGKLILFEITDPQYLVVNFVFGLLPGWWLSEEAHREGGPLLSAGQWGDHLIGNGFTGLDVVLNDFPTVEHQHTSVLVSSVFEAGPDAKSGKTCILLTQDASPLQQSVAEGLLHVLEQEGTCINRLLHQVSEEDLLGSTCIILGELDVPILSKLDADDFKALKHAVKYCQGLVWATRGGVGSIALPEMELITGLAKGIRGDKPGFATVCVSFEEATTAMEIIDRMIQLLKNPGGLQESERAFRVFDKVVHTPRLVDAKYLAEHIEAQTRSLSTVEDRLGNHTDEALKLEIVTLGLLDTLRFANDPIFATPLGEYEVEIKVMCCGMNFHDLASMLGKIDESPLGLEASGIVTRCGPKTSLKIGDEVFGLFFDGSLKTYARTHESFLATMRPSLSWTEAAAVPIAFTTAYTVLHELGTARSGDTILMHSAAGGFGQAVIQLAQHAGLEVFVTVGSTAKRDFMEATYNIPRDHIFSSRDLTFKTQVLLQTNSRGVDIVINTLSGEALQASWDCVAPFGRFVELGLKDININSRIPMKNFERGCRFESLDLTYFARHDPVRAHRAFQRTVAVVVDELKDSIHSLPVTSYPYSQTQEAFRFMQSGRHIGKLVLQPQDDDLVTIVPSQLPVCYLDQNASYVIAGGFGGLGRSIARWMVSQGVENLILLSRRGESDDSAIAFVTELRERCRHVAAPSCDVTDVVSLKRSIADCMEYMPPVKGCIQGSMVLRVSNIDMLVTLKKPTNIHSRTIVSTT